MCSTLTRPNVRLFWEGGLRLIIGIATQITCVVYGENAAKSSAKGVQPRKAVSEPVNGVLECAAA